MLPVEVARHYTEITQHLLDEIQRLQLENIRLRHDVERALKNHAADLGAEGKTESKGNEV